MIPTLEPASLYLQQGTSSTGNRRDAAGENAHGGLYPP